VWHPKPYAPRWLTSRRAQASAIVVAVVVTAASCIVRHSPPPASAPMPTPGDALEVTPHPLSLGVVKAGAKARAEVCLANRGARAVVTQRIETSCPCLAAEPQSFRVEPEGREVLVIEFDSSAESDFHGKLSIAVVGYAAERETFRTEVDVEVSTNTAANLGESATFKVRGS
jgi:hypothetical protein